jgi:hypothetical protein
MVEEDVDQAPVVEQVPGVGDVVISIQEEGRETAATYRLGVSPAELPEVTPGAPGM